MTNFAEFSMFYQIDYVLVLFMAKIEGATKHGNLQKFVTLSFFKLD